MSSNELERKWQRAVFWAYVGDSLRALFWIGIVPVVLAIINYLERMTW